MSVYEALDRWQTNCHYQKWETWSGSLPIKGLSASDVALKLRSQGIFPIKGEWNELSLNKTVKWSLSVRGMKILNTQSLRMVWFSLKFWNNWEKSEEWLLAELEKEGYDNVLDIFIAEYDKGKINVVTY